ncbi:Zn-finger domain-containing nucleic acid-binding protein [Desulfatibacillum alkenivorans DSM 16219]|jgi:Zn-finger nucleic acid-binding protein|uniref:Zn-finger domain-containing nucleic acid-binding protein n=1 Tax=Desulfatibacillum alkenivorans DSM 16219 TaxID=1121393 RepID=A0A1M6TIR9_9BACT|nr:zf-TFIIB domain-containing protein [Desulfatibacillum alkenivorans]SHK56824.1 Zn-finger domain-containing nucleic acid-binding protein [Desulfatibacillum alkenivorans DSM 16219]
MDCPVCKNAGLTREKLEQDLVAYSCAQCGGRMIVANDYSHWLEKHGETLPEKPFSDISLEIHDVEKAKFCPECSRLMVKYKVGHGLDFKIDRCGGCGGVWLDANEWEAMKDRNLHDEINSVFTAPWQAGVRQEQNSQTLDALYAEKFGDQDYSKIKEIRSWLDGHPKRQAILHFLSDDSPYKA